MVPQPEVFVSPPKWHLGHTTWFFETFILEANEPSYQEFSPDYNFIFNSYYEAIGKRVNRQTTAACCSGRPWRTYWPTAATWTMPFLAWLDGHPDNRLLSLLPELGLQHEQQHQELIITDTKYIFSQNPLLPVWGGGMPTKPGTFPVARNGGLVGGKGRYHEIGLQGEGFCFDNGRYTNNTSKAPN